MAKITKYKKNKFTTLSNTVIEDERLSWKARGIFQYLYSKSDDWQFYTDEVVKHSQKDKMAALRTGLGELETHGYLKRIQKKTDAGKFGTYDWVISDEPILNEPDNDFPQAEKPEAEKPQADNRTLPNTDLPNTDLTNSSGSSKGKTNQNAMQKISAYYQEAGFEMLNAIMQQDIQYTLEEVTELNNGDDQVSADFMIYCLEQAALNNVLSWKYAKAIINRHIKLHHTTRELAMKADEDFKNKGTQRKSIKEQPVNENWKAVEEASQKTEIFDGPF
ncbi:hypothetical protein D3P96_02845 [Weissella viridescens]|uniref:DnaB/C C-terminal domain-containing protein n=1 Tax=Weissella viridescens TaxID=1629 RepID=A0A3P2RKQ6_WEIVI|nr:hypothetical protein [Weissella viridescens]RRG18242.1 hypothetical protein D3P96_02845 [Weissella viridescens]